MTGANTVSMLAIFLMLSGNVFAEPQVLMTKDFIPSIVVEQLKKQELLFDKKDAFLSKKPQTTSIKSEREELQQASSIVNSSVKAIQGDDNVNYSPDQLTLYRTTETIRALNNPVWVICNSAPWPNSDRNGWMDYINPILGRISEISASVGVFVSYYVAPDGSLTYVDHGATGFVVGKNYVMTNKHVLEKYAYVDRAGWHLRTSQELHIKFPQEYSRCKNQTQSKDVKIIGIKDVGSQLNEDYAILEAETINLPPSVPLSTNFNLGFSARIIALGYPERPRPCQRDEIPNANDPCTFLTNPQIDALFLEPNKSKSEAPEFPAERISPGVILPNTMISKEYFSYDSSTWGGSSGSPIISLVDGMVVGLHFEGVGGNIKGIGYNNAIKIESLTPKLKLAGVL